MRVFLKKYKVIILLLGVEIYFYYYTRNHKAFDFEMFFMGWSVVWLMFLCFSLMGSGPTGALRGVGSSYSTLAGGMAEIDLGNKKIRKNKRFMKPINLVYFILFLLNVIGYIIIFMVKY